MSKPFYNIRFIFLFWSCCDAVIKKIYRTTLCHLDKKDRPKENWIKSCTIPLHRYTTMDFRLQIFIQQPSIEDFFLYIRDIKKKFFNSNIFWSSLSRVLDKTISDDRLWKERVRKDGFLLDRTDTSKRG